MSALYRKKSVRDTYHKKIVGTRAFVRVDLQREPKEVPEHRGQSMLLLDLGRAIGGNEPQSAQRTLIEIGWLSFNHLNCHDTQGPDIDLVAVFFLLDNLGRHPVRCADHGGTLGSLLCELVAESEIG